MKIVVLFGLPGAGKTYVGKVAEEHFGYHLYDGDQGMSDAYKKAVIEEKMTDELREEFFDHLIENVKKLKEEKIIVTQTFIKERFREQFLLGFPLAKLVLIETSTKVREKRLLNSNRFALSLEKWRKMSKIFEKPQIPYDVIYNNEEGEEKVKEQLYKILV